MRTSVNRRFRTVAHSRLIPTTSINALCIAALLTVTNAHAASNLADLSLEELATLTITSVSKAAKPISQAPASVFVITEKDIRRAGSATLPEALRLAPNLQVSRVDARNYAVTARGFNNPFANKLLVMIDGRTVYSPLFSGVYWDAQDVVLEDLERIEVVSGPGGTLWGANAVNGVVNIVSRSAADTQGGLVSLGGSDNEHHAAGRYGGSLNGDGHYRVYAKHSQHDDTLNANGDSTFTGWERTQSGFRADWGQDVERLTVQGDAYSGRLHQAGTDDIKISGANILARKAWEYSSASKVSFQAYIDHTQRDQPLAFSQHLNTVDLELQHEWNSGRNHHLVWGGGYRYVSDEIDNDDQFSFLPEELSMQWANLFVQDEISLTENVELTVGSKFEHNPFTDWEFMPSAQLSWTPSTTQLVWTSASRAVRTPSRIDRDLYSPSNPPVVDGVPQFFIAGGPDFKSEIANVLEIGYRTHPTVKTLFSITTFYSEYDHIRTLELNTNGPGLVFMNMADAKSHGVELWGSWQVTDKLRLHSGFVAQEFEVTVDAGSADLTNTTGLANADPEFFGILRSTYDISERVELDSTLRHVDKLQGAQVPAYTALDIRLGWEITSNLEFSLIGQNLLEDRHVEFGSAPGHSVYERGVYGKLLWGL